MSDADFKAWGWRIPFLLSAVLVVVSYYIRARMAESPLFAKLKAEGKTDDDIKKELTFRQAAAGFVFCARI